MVVEDCPFIQRQVAHVLERLSLRFVVVGTVREALRAIEGGAVTEGGNVLGLSGDLGLLLCDIDLPDGKGFDVARAATRACPGAGRCAYTASEEPTITADCERAGFAEVLMKPARLGALTELIARHYRVPAVRREAGLV